MKGNRFYFAIIIRVVLITLNSFVLIWFYTQTSRPATTLFFFLLIILQTISLIMFLNHVNRDLANFLVYLQENDTSLVFSRNRMEKNFKNAMTGLNEINRKIQDARVSREEKHQYLQAVIEQVETGILTYNSEGKVEMVNKAALDILGISALPSITILKTNFPKLQEIFNSGKDGLVKINSHGRSMEIAIKMKNFRIGNETIRIASLQNINAELEERELESWKKLIRVLRHEIMNSITTVTTLTTAIKRCFKINSNRKPLEEITEENIEDALLSAEVIEERSKGIISFVEKFRSITDVPEPVMKLFPVRNVFERVKLLFGNLLKEKDISLTIESSEIQLNADEHLLEQVIINLVKNSVEAVEEGGKILLKAFKNEAGENILWVEDNGYGISTEDLENIFIPSYTTKENSMGVGLSISKQIIQLHQGEIRVNSVPGNTVFEIILK